MIYIIILLIIIILVGIVAILCDDVGRPICMFFLFILSMVLGAIIEAHNESKQPSALDVYNDKTELRITSVNGVPVDTVVVFKTK
jgi:small-conductance mechanosensitive channel